MSVELNHTIIWAHDKAKSAAFLAGILNLPVGQEWGPFVPVQVSNGVTLDYADAEGIQSQNYAFLLNEDEFDAAFTRLQESGLTLLRRPLSSALR